MAEAPEVVIWGTGKPKREFLYADDLADACVFLMQNYYDDEIINIGVGEDVSIKELSHLIAKVIGFKGKLTYDPNYPDGTPRKLLDVSRLAAMGWNPQITLKEGLEKTYDWFIHGSASN